MWTDLGVAMCLVLVIEGIMPFAAPRRWRQMVLSVAQADDRTLRLVGFASMAVGATLLYVIR